MRAVIALAIAAALSIAGISAPASAAPSEAGTALSASLERLGSDVSRQAVIVVKRQGYAPSVIEVDTPRRYKVTDGHTVRIVDGDTTYDSLTEADKARARNAGKQAIYVTSPTDDTESVSLFDNADLVRASAALGTTTSKPVGGGTRYDTSIDITKVDLTGSAWEHSSALLSSGVKDAKYRVWTDKTGRITRIRGTETIYGVPKPVVTTWKATYSKNKVTLTPVDPNLAMTMHEVDALELLDDLEKAAYDIVDSTYHLVDTTNAKASIDLIVTAAAGVPTPHGLTATYEGDSLKLTIEDTSLCLTATGPTTVSVTTC